MELKNLKSRCPNCFQNTIRVRNKKNYAIKCYNCNSIFLFDGGQVEHALNVFFNYKKGK